MYLEEDKLEMKLLDRSLCCRISNTALKLPLKIFFKIFGLE